MVSVGAMRCSAAARWADIYDVEDEVLFDSCGPRMHKTKDSSAEYETDDELWFPRVDCTKYLHALHGSAGVQNQPSGVHSTHQTAAEHSREQDSCRGSLPRKVTKVAEALDEVDAYDPKTVVRVNGLRALGDDGIGIVARYLDKHVGAVVREVPVIVRGTRGQRKLSNFGFIVMSCASEAEQIIACCTLVVDGHEIAVRAYAVKHAEAQVDAQRPMEDNGSRADECNGLCHRGSAGI